MIKTIESLTITKCSSSKSRWNHDYEFCVNFQRTVIIKTGIPKPYLDLLPFQFMKQIQGNFRT